MTHSFRAPLVSRVSGLETSKGILACEFLNWPHSFIILKQSHFHKEHKNTRTSQQDHTAENCQLLGIVERRGNNMETTFSFHQNPISQNFESSCISFSSHKIAAYRKTFITVLIQAPKHRKNPPSLWLGLPITFQQNYQKRHGNILLMTVAL